MEATSDPHMRHTRPRSVPVSVSVSKEVHDVRLGGVCFFLGHRPTLVKATDLAPWYAHLTAPREVIEQARDDFGDMILTWDTILAEPGPYSVTEGTIVGR